MCRGHIAHLTRVQASSSEGIRFIRKLPARPSAITLPRTFDSCSAQIRERRSHRRRARQRGAGSNGTNVAWGLSSPPCWHLSRPLTQTSQGQVRKEARLGQGRWNPAAGPWGRLPPWHGVGPILPPQGAEGPSGESLLFFYLVIEGTSTHH